MQLNLAEEGQRHIAVAIVHAVAVIVPHHVSNAVLVVPAMIRLALHPALIADVVERHVEHRGPVVVCEKFVNAQPRFLQFIVGSELVN